MQGESRKVVLLLDSASQHQKEVLNAISNSNIQVVFIPGGCTSLLQPLDLTINKQLKEKIKASYLSWLNSKETQIRNLVNDDPETISSTKDFTVTGK